MTRLAFQLRSKANLDHVIKLGSVCFATTVITCKNEEMPQDKASELKKASMSQKILHQIFRKELPTPRLLSPSDPIFQSSEMKRCLEKRKADEKSLAGIQKDLIACAQARDRVCIELNMQKVNEVLYGEGVTMQAREEFLVKYGCTPYDDDILDKILSFDRPIMDVGGEFSSFILSTTISLLKWLFPQISSSILAHKYFTQTFEFGFQKLEMANGVGHFRID